MTLFYGISQIANTSMILWPYTVSHASMIDAEKATIGLTPQLVRLSIGLENTQDLIDDLSKAFEAIGVRQ
jgi:cystathionine beta-lyase/cystathionine gamma-synthase